MAYVFDILRSPVALLSLGLLLIMPVGVAAKASEAPKPSRASVTVHEVVNGLDHPWSLAFLPDGGMLITERPGRLRLLDKQGRLSKAIKGVPEVWAQGQGGLLEVALSPDFAQDRYVYLSYARAGEQAAGTALGRGRLSQDESALEDFTELFVQQPQMSRGHHFGGRIAFGPQGHLYLTLGENNQRKTAQDLDKHQGSVVRLNPDGSVPNDNPFVDKAEARPEIWTYGHRNAQGLAFNPWSGQLWSHEHGPRGGDEINVIQKGKNYGWPRATYGIDYSGQPIPEAEGDWVEGSEPPLLWWRQSPAISGMAFYDHERFPQWQHSLFIGALAGRALLRLTVDGDRITAEERLLHERGERIREVRVGPDGFVYVLTDESNGALLRLSPPEP